MSAKGRRLNPFQAARKRPAVVIGDCSFGERNDWVAALNAEVGEPLIVFRSVNRNQGLIRIVIEALSNAIDNAWRSKEQNIPMKKIGVSVNQTTGMVSIYNDGAWIPVVKQQFEYEDYRTKKTTVDEVYPAEFYFGEMYAGTNFEGDDERKTSGRNGMGAKAIVVFSNSTEVEHSDPEAKKKFVQTFGKAGETRTDPVITAYRAKTGYTKISFVPDYEFFNYPGCDDDFVATLKKMAYDTAMITNVPVYFGLTDTEGNETSEKMVFKTMKPYISLYFPGEKSVVSFETDKGDECVIVQRSNFETGQRDEPFQQSWINGILTPRGGRHVDAWKSAVFMRLLTAFNKTRKPNEMKAQVKDFYSYVMIFVKSERLSSEIDFDSQAKEYLTKPETFELSSNKASQAALVDQINLSIKKILKWSFIKVLKDGLDAKVSSKLEREDSKVKIKFGEKVKNAKFAGPEKKGKDCTFWIGEGDSAVRFVERMISKLPNGYDYNGWVPIGGKSQNPEKWTTERLFDNPELKDIKNALGLKIGMKAEDMHKLRYGRVMIAADADTDGDHIRGLLTCFFYHFWPEICEQGFVWFFSTAVVRIRQAKKEIPFYSEEEFRKFCETRKVSPDTIYYFKGLSTHQPPDTKLYLEDPHYVHLQISKKSSEVLKLAFQKKDGGADSRKKWMIERYFSLDDKSPVHTIYQYKGDVPIENFIHGPFLIYSAESTRRAIPDAIDGLKHSQRQALFGMLKINPKKSVSVEKLSGNIGEISGYHHGAASLYKTIIKMAQRYPGSNNIPLFRNDGEFGTRILGGDDAGAARYVTTRLEQITRKIFRQEDDPILEYEFADGVQVQPTRYVPILPLGIINGSHGIGTGWNTKTPNYDPLKVVEWIETYLSMIEESPELANDLPDLPPLKPWFLGFKGEIAIDEQYPPKFWISKGILYEESRKTVSGKTSKLTEWHITELPVGVWTEAAKVKLDKMWDAPKGSTALLAEEPEDRRSEVDEVHFVIRPTKDFTPDMETLTNPIRKLLVKRDHLTQLNFLNSRGMPTNFSSVEDIMLEHAKTRLVTYEKRKEYWISHFQKLLKKARNKYIYVKSVVEGELDMHQTDQDLEKAMIELGLEKIGEENTPGSYDYLLSMQMRSMSKAKMEELQKDAKDLCTKIESLQSETAISLWRKELEEFKEAYSNFLRTRV